MSKHWANILRQRSRPYLFSNTLAPGDVDRIVLVGGSSLMRSVQEAAQEVCPRARLESGKALTGVADGLALSAASAFA